MGKFKDYCVTLDKDHDKLFALISSSMKDGIMEAIDNVIDLKISTAINSHIDENVLEWCESLFKENHVFNVSFDEKIRPIITIRLIDNWLDDFNYSVRIEDLYDNEFEPEDRKIIATALRALADKYDEDLA